MVTSERSTEGDAPVDRDSRAWVERLRARGRTRDEAVAELHALLLNAARFEIRRRRATATSPRHGDHEDLAHQSADDALVSILRRLEEFRGESRFTTWAYKFALYEAATKLRRRAWEDREIPLSDAGWARIADRSLGPHADVETRDRLAAIREAIADDLTALQREVLVALVLNEVPIDVLAARRNTTRGALYKALHDGRRKLRASLIARGLSPDEPSVEVPT